MHHWSDARRRALAQIDLTQDPLFSNLPVLVRDLGFEYWCLAVLDQNPAAPPLLLSTNLPAVWLHQYGQGRFYLQDPRRVHAESSIKPLHWQAEHFAETPQLWTLIGQAGLTQGMTQACHYGPVVVLLCLCRAEPELGGEEFSSKTGDVLRLANELTVASVERIAKVYPGPAELPHPLTRREVAILALAAAGQTASLIGSELALSERTVQFHINGAIKKLGVSNKTAAVAQAILLGLIRP